MDNSRRSEDRNEETARTEHRHTTAGQGRNEQSVHVNQQSDRIGPETDRLDSATAFALLGNEIRLEIVTSLHEGRLDGPIPFSELYAELGVDDTGKFNYHLSKLVPHFVSKTEDGYELTAAGNRIARALAAGMYTDSPEFGPVGIDGECYRCGTSALVAAYSDERLRISCDSCDDLILGVTVPPSIVRNRTVEAVIDAFDRWSRIEVEQAWQGLCPNCGGAVTWDLLTDPPEHLGFDVLPSFRCEICGMVRSTSFGALTYRIPEVRSFYRRHELDVTKRPYWEIETIMDTKVTLLSEDPWRIRVTCTAGSEACLVDFDADVRVVRTEVVDRQE